jgi:hypothetical protein
MNDKTVGDRITPSPWDKFMAVYYVAVPFMYATAVVLCAVERWWLQAAIFAMLGVVFVIGRNSR